VLAVAGLLAGARYVFGGGAAPTTRVHWPASLSGQVYTRPYAIGGRLYVGNQNGHVYALNAFTGAVRWQYPLKGQSPLDSISARPSVADHKVYVVTSTGRLYALNAATGTVEWSYPQAGRTGSALTSPVYLDGNVFFGSGNWLYALNAQSGAFLRRHWLAGPVSGVLADSQHAMGTPLEQRTLYVGAGRHLYALNPANRQVRWQYTLDSGATALPSLSADGGTVFVDTTGTLYALDTTSKGQLEWRHPIPGQAQYQPAVANGVVYVGTGDDVYAITTDNQVPSGWPRNGRVRLPEQVSGPVVAFGTVFVGSGRWLYCLDASTGRTCGQWPGPFRADGLVATPVLANGRVYAGTIGGHVYAVSASTRR